MKTVLVVAPLSAVVGFLLAVALASNTSVSAPQHAKTTHAAPKPEPTAVLPAPAHTEEEPAVRVGTRTISWRNIVGRLRDIEGINRENRVFSDSVEYTINCALLELEAERLQVFISDKMIASEVQRQVDELKRQVKEKFGESFSWRTWLKEMGFDDGQLHTYLERGVRTILLKRVLVNAAETQCNNTQLKDRLYEFLAFADIDDKRFKRWLEDVKKTRRYPIEYGPALKGE